MLVDDVKKLFERYVAGRCTPAEVRQLMQCFYADEIGQLDRLIRAELIPLRCPQVVDRK